MLFLILCNYTECEKMFDELKAQIEGIKKDILDLRQGQATSYSTSNMDELENLFSSLDGNYSPFTANATTPQANLFSPPPSSPPFQFRPKANSVPPIYLQPDGTEWSASQAQKMRGLQGPPSGPSTTSLVPLQLATPDPSINTPLLPAPLPPATLGLSIPVPLQSTTTPLQSTTTCNYPSTPTHSAPSVPGPFTPVQSGSAMKLQEPMPIPSKMPIKTAEEVIAKYNKYMTKDLVGRVAVKLARNTYFGEAV